MSQTIFIINGPSDPIDKLSKVYINQKIEFANKQHGKKLILAPRVIILSISLLELSIKDYIA